MSKRAAMVTDDGGGPFAELPPDLHHHLRPFFADITEEVVRAIRTEIPEYARPADDTYMQGVHRGVDHALRGFLERMAKPDSDWEPVQATYQRIGRGEAEEGRSLDSFQSALRLGARVTWRRVNALVDADLLPRNVLGAFGEALFLHLDEMAAATTAGYTEARLHAAGELQQRRMRLIDLLTADPPASPEAIAELAHSARWPVPKSLAVVAIDYTPQPPPPPTWPTPTGTAMRPSPATGSTTKPPSPTTGPVTRSSPTTDGHPAPKSPPPPGDPTQRPTAPTDGPVPSPPPPPGGPALKHSPSTGGQGPRSTPPMGGPVQRSSPSTGGPVHRTSPSTGGPAPKAAPSASGAGGRPSPPAHGPARNPAFPARGPIVPPEFLGRFDVEPAVLVVPDPEGPGRARAVAGALQGLRAAMGPTVSLQEGARSLRWASEALELVRRGVLWDAEMVRCQDHLATLLLLRDDALVDAMAERRLRPLEQVRPPQRERLAETLLSWLSSGHNASEVAVRLAVHPQTVRYRMRQLDELFGDQLHDPAAQFEMMLALRALQLRRGVRGSGAE
ncbi:helix-turn-helix domain-containing protein [Streptomyces justiciae]|uniref:Helix-turn-helix domain-containing protein n=1 Tax=Streptomyces justiciae TaxID=2780140 RepID=A0ABU3LN15_9ACTN|nr:helix-turn-helix domain-containing protein [Streptomyces justiciae]MDT7840621.1 helix-turn-helix domain-containing protein [Streptomyces justiciae]